MPAGRPPKYKNVADLQAKIEEYFANVPTRQCINADGDPVAIPVITITGLVLHLGFCDRHSFYDYEKQPKFSHTIKRARLLIENDYEMQLKTQSSGQAGIIFGLKNLGWKDKTEQEITGTMANNLTVEFVSADDGNN